MTVWQHIVAVTRATRGSVSVIGALSLTGVIGMSAFAVELGHAYTTRVDNQSVADAAALSGALSYMRDANSTKAFQAARNVAQAAGVPASAVTASVVDSRRNASLKAIHVEVRTVQQVYLARVIGAGPTLDVLSVSDAEIGGTDPACIIALNTTAVGVSVSSSSSITAVDCGVASNASITATSSGTISAKSVTTGSTVTTDTSGTVTTTPTALNIRQNAANAARNPFTGNTALAAEFAKIGTGSAPATPTVLTGADFVLPTSGTTYLFGLYNVTKKADGKWYAPAGVYTIRKLSLSGQRLVFEGTSAAETALTFSGNIDVSSSSTLEIGVGDVSSTGALNVSSSSSATIGAGRHYFKSISGSSTWNITIGDGDLDVAGGVTSNSSGILTVGTGTKLIGGNVTVDSSGSLILGDGALSVRGNLSAGSSATLKIGAAAEQHINGDFTVDSSATVQLGAGRYYVKGKFGGTSSASYTGVGVSVFATDAIDVTSSGSTSFSAPLSDGSTSIGNIAFASLTSSASSFGSSGTGTLKGVVYLPNSNLSVTSSGALGSSTGCLIVVAAKVTNNSSGKIQTKCSNLSSAFGSGGISLVN